METVTEFTPLTSTLGGAMIGLSALILMGGVGRIAGISGIVSRMLPPGATTSNSLSGIVFVIGLLIAAPVYHMITGAPPLQTVSGNLLLLGIAGVLVGFGSVFGNGCTSGHGVCGVSRLSGRSIIATITFMATAFITVLLMRHF